MKVRGIVFIGLTACGFSPSQVVGDGGGIDAAPPPVDADLGDAPAACTMWHPVHFMPCNLGSPMDPAMLMPPGSPYKYDTTTDGGDLTDKNGTLIAHSAITLEQTDSSYVAVFSVANFGVAAGVQLNVVGTKPLLVASWGMIDVMGTIDVGSHTTETDGTAHIQQTTTFGAGAQTIACGTSAAGVGTDAVPSGGSGGGGGGAFHGNGGKGADGDTNCTAGNTCPRAGGPGGGGSGEMPSVLRAGCPGADSGAAGTGVSAPATATTVSKGGFGGGALELAAMGEIHVMGTIRSGGAAGAGAPQGSAAGGGGGGGGGYIAFDSHDMVMIGGIVATNGAGGGGSAPFANFGHVGQDGQASQAAAAGGAVFDPTHVNCGLAGGNGSTSDNGADALLNDACGGGGGGGGAGWVISYTSNATGAGMVSPTLTVVSH